MITPYEKAIENQMVVFFDALSEKNKRRYVGVETLKLPYGGRSYIRELLNCRFPTIDKGIEELKDKNLSNFYAHKKSWGRKEIINSEYDRGG